jgi:hypothetical protein
MHLGARPPPVLDELWDRQIGQDRTHRRTKCSLMSFAPGLRRRCRPPFRNIGVCDSTSLMASGSGWDGKIRTVFHWGSRVSTRNVSTLFDVGMRAHGCLLARSVRTDRTNSDLLSASGEPRNLSGRTSEILRTIRNPRPNGAPAGSWDPRNARPTVERQSDGRLVDRPPGWILWSPNLFSGALGCSPHGLATRDLRP